MSCQPNKVGLSQNKRVELLTWKTVHPNYMADALERQIEPEGQAELIDVALFQKATALSAFLKKINYQPHSSRVLLVFI